MDVYIIDNMFSSKTYIIQNCNCFIYFVLFIKLFLNNSARVLNLTSSTRRLCSVCRVIESDIIDKMSSSVCRVIESDIIDQTSAFCVSCH